MRATTHLGVAKTWFVLNLNNSPPLNPPSQITSCNENLDDSICSEAVNNCNSKILSPLAGDYNVYYVLSTDDSYPPDFSKYINSVKTKIGAEITWTQTSQDVYNNFAGTGDWMKSSIGDLEKVIDAGIRTVIFVGDAVSLLLPFERHELNLCRTTSATTWVLKGWSPV